MTEGSIQNGKTRSKDSEKKKQSVFKPYENYGEYGIRCYHCSRGFYLNGFRYRCANTVSCMFCGKRIVKARAEMYDG